MGATRNDEIMDLQTYRILAILEPRPLRAADVMERLRGEVRRDAPSIPSFYRLLKQQLDKGNLEIARTVSDGGRGRPQHVYRLTPAGRRGLQEQAERLQVLAALVLRPDEEGR